MNGAGDLRAVILVEGISDQVAVETLAVRRGRNLGAERISVVPIGGAKNIRRFLELFGPRGFDVTCAGLYDAAEARDFVRGLERAGLGSDLAVTDLESFGFFRCDADLEDELIRALGVEAVEHIIEANGEIGAFRTLQKQAAQQGRTTAAQLHRFMGSKSGRKIKYARLLVATLDLEAMPRPLDQVLARVA